MSLTNWMGKTIFCFSGLDVGAVGRAVASQDGGLKFKSHLDRYFENVLPKG